MKTLIEKGYQKIGSKPILHKPTVGLCIEGKGY